MNGKKAMPNLPQDNEARRAAVDIRRSFIVSAPAGSGKTGLLTLRVLKLLSQVQTPEEVLSITFTRKAAREMHERIFGALRKAKQCLSHPELLSTLNSYEKNIIENAQAALKNDENREWALLQNPHRLKISTIDGFCKSICNHLPLASGLGANAGIIEQAEPEYIRVAGRWMTNALNKASTGSAFAILLQQFSGNLELMQKMLAKMLAIRDQWLDKIGQSKAGGEHVRGYFERCIADIVTENINKCLPYFLAHEAELCDLIHYASTQVGDGRQAATLERLSQYQQFPDTEDGAETYWRALAEFCLTTTGEYRSRLDKHLGFPPGTTKEDKEKAKNKKNALLRILSEVKDAGLQADVFAALKNLPNKQYSDEQWQVLQALVDVLPELTAELKLRFIEVSKADFVEFSLGAVRALDQDDGEIHLQQKLDYRIQHILIDEFQDTSEVQYALLKGLTREWQHDDGRSLFLVGDGMQSCYGFRNADVGIFLQLRDKGLPNITIHALDLRVNFRSSPTVVDWVNKVFSASFPEANDVNCGAVKYIPSSPFKEDSHSLVQCCAFNSEASGQDEAEFITEKIHELRQRAPEESVAILAKNRSHLSSIVTALSAKNIPFQAIDIDALNSKQHIIDLLNITRLLHRPQDTLAMLALLRSPFCALNHQDLFHIFNVPDRKTHSGLPLDWCNYALEHQQLSNGGHQRLQRFVRVLRDILSIRQRRPLCQCVERLWLKLGGPKTLTSDADIADVHRYIELVQASESGHSINDWQEFESALNKLYANPASAAHNPVQLMTMHKSKGLEFDNVFLPSLQKGRRPADAEILYWMEHHKGDSNTDFILSPLSDRNTSEEDGLSRYIRRHRAEKTLLEDLRVFYVACTRARHRLYLSASLKKDADGVLKPPESKSLLGRIWTTIESSIEDLSTENTTEINSHIEPAEPSAALFALPEQWSSSLFSTGEPPQAQRFNNKGVNVLTKQRIHAPNAVAKGLAFHAILQTIVNIGFETYFNHNIEHMKRFWHAQLIQSCYHGKDTQQVTEHFAQTLQVLYQDRLARWILDRTHKDSRAEWPIHNGEQNYIIDRSFIDEKNTRWIIDYKCSSPLPGQDLRQFVRGELANYQDQLNHYFQAVKSYDVEQDNLVKATSTALYFPFIQHLEVVDTNISEER